MAAAPLRRLVLCNAPSHASPQHAKMPSSFRISDGIIEISWIIQGRLLSCALAPSSRFARLQRERLLYLVDLRLALPTLPRVGRGWCNGPFSVTWVRTSDR